RRAHRCRRPGTILLVRAHPRASQKLRDTPPLPPALAGRHSKARVPLRRSKGLSFVSRATAEAQVSQILLPVCRDPCSVIRVPRLQHPRMQPAIRHSAEPKAKRNPGVRSGDAFQMAERPQPHSPARSRGSAHRSVRTNRAPCSRRSLESSLRLVDPFPTSKQKAPISRGELLRFSPTTKLKRTQSGRTTLPRHPPKETLGERAMDLARSFPRRSGCMALQLQSLLAKKSPHSHKFAPQPRALGPQTRAFHVPASCYATIQ